MKSESSAKLGDVDFAHLAPPVLSSSRSSNNKHYLQDSSATATTVHGDYDPHSAFTSLKSSETNDNNNLNNLGDIQSAFFPASSKLPHFAVDSAIASDAATGKLGANSLPGAPQDLRAPIIKARFVILSWRAPLINADNIQTYTVYYKHAGSERERVQNTTRSRLEEINIAGLMPERVYHFRVAGINSFGMGQSSDSLTITTQAEEHVASAPLQFDAFATSPHSIHVSWKVPEISNGPILRYIVYYMEVCFFSLTNFMV